MWCVCVMKHLCVCGTWHLHVVAMQCVPLMDFMFVDDQSGHI